MLSVINMSNINIINDNCKNAQSRIIGILLSFIEKPVISLIITYWTVELKNIAGCQSNDDITAFPRTKCMLYDTSYYSKTLVKEFLHYSDGRLQCHKYLT